MISIKQRTDSCATYRYIRLYEGFKERPFTSGYVERNGNGVLAIVENVCKVSCACVCVCVCVNEDN